MRQRLEPCAEARLRLADALRHRAYATAIERVHVEHAIGLAEPERAQHDRLGLVAAGHGSSLGRTPVGTVQNVDCKVTLTSDSRSVYPAPL